MTIVAVEKQYILNILPIMLVLVIRHTNRIFYAPYCTVTCGLSGSAIFVHIS